jgi:signal transduction histidine kinase
MALARRIIGPERAYRAFRDYAKSQHLDIHELAADAALIAFVERQLAGSIGAASASVLVSRIAGGETISLEEVITILDETQQAIEYSRQLEQKSAELEAIAAQLRAANAQLKEIDTMKDDFLSRVSHELRTPMTSVRSFAEVLLEERDLSAEKRDRFLSIIHQESQRLTRLLDEILDLNRLESGEQALRLAEIDAVAMVREALASMSGFAHQRGVGIVDRLPRGLPRISVDGDRLMQVIINLVHNAIKFNSAEAPQVTIEAELRGSNVVLAVADNGPGIAPDEIDDIFRKFSRRRPGSEGSGLGLAICKEIVEGHGGEIRVRSTLGHGARFEVILPASAETAAAAAAE